MSRWFILGVVVLVLVVAALAWPVAQRVWAKNTLGLLGANALVTPDLSKPVGYVKLPGDAPLFDPGPVDVPKTDAAWTTTMVVGNW